MASPTLATRRQAKHMHIEGVATRRSLRPPGPSEGVAAHHRTEALDQRRCQSGLDRRQRHPGAADPQQAVSVECGRIARRVADAPLQGASRARTSGPGAGTRTQSSSMSTSGGGASVSTRSSLGTPPRRSSSRRSPSVGHRTSTTSMTARKPRNRRLPAEFHACERWHRLRSPPVARARAAAPLTRGDGDGTGGRTP